MHRRDVIVEAERAPAVRSRGAGCPVVLIFVPIGEIVAAVLFVVAAVVVAVAAVAIIIVVVCTSICITI